MGKDLAEALPDVRAMFERADGLLGVPLTKMIFEGPEAVLVDTSIQQPALVLVSLAVLRAVELKLGRPLDAVAAAGLSLGEYAAQAAVGALTFDAAIQLVRRRGQLMHEAAQQVAGGMAVVLGMDEAKATAACAQAAKDSGGVVSPCNFNGGGQIVIGGALPALAKAMELCKAAGARRVMKLPVSGAFHTALMEPAARQFRDVLAGTPFERGRVPVYANVSAQPVQEPGEVRESLEKQLTSPVRWEQTVQNLVAAGHTRFLELGAGTTLSNLIRRIAPDAQIQNVGTWAEVQAFAG
jgi:[acyl-carrier-protein] S-malonyltransferase